MWLRPHFPKLSDEDQKALLVVLDSLVKRSRIRRVMTNSNGGFRTIAGDIRIWTENLENLGTWTPIF